MAEKSGDAVQKSSVC